MGKGKPRHNPDKPQNQYGGDYECEAFDEYHDGVEFCHQTEWNHWNRYVEWWKRNNNGELECKGNRHKCNKMRLQWLASLTEKERNKYARQWSK